jgi:hypothetical protein
MAAMLKRDEAKQRIIAEWHPWILSTHITNANENDGFAFFHFIYNEHPQLLNFKARGDKWQHVHSWLLAADLVNS